MFPRVNSVLRVIFCINPCMSIEMKDIAKYNVMLIVLLVLFI